MKNLLSVCISVHNTEKYLPRCLDSILRQTYKNLEIVLVDNGSTDNSYNVMKNYIQTYPDKIRIYRQKDKGLAQGRNTGIINSNGDFITFLDADDYVENNAYEKMMSKIIKDESDIVECQTIKDNIIISSNLFKPIDSQTYLNNLFLYGKYPIMLWLRIYKKKLFTKGVVPEIYTNNEDNYIFPCLVFNSKKISFVNETLHHYMTDNDSGFMNQLNTKKLNYLKIKRNRINALKAVKFVKNYININEKSQYYNGYQKYITRYIIEFLFFDLQELKISERISILSDVFEIDYKEIRKLILKNYKYGKLMNIFAIIFGNILGLKLFSRIRKIYKR